MKKDLNKKANKNNIVGIILTIIILVGIFLGIDFALNTDKSEISNKSELSEFEKIAIYNYIEDEFLDYDLLHKLSNLDEFENNKLEYIIAYSMKKSNSKTVSYNDVANNYKKLFGEEFNISNTSTISYASNEEKQEYEIKKEVPVQENGIYIMKITEIQQISLEENIVKIDILQPKSIDEFINYYMADSEKMMQNGEILKKLEELRMKNITNSTIEAVDAETSKYLNSLITDENQNILTQKVTDAELKLKINNNQYSIIGYSENKILE